MLAKLDGLKNKAFESRDVLSYELDKYLPRDEIDVYRDAVLNSARVTVLDKDEYARYKDVIVEHAEGIKYLLTRKSLAALTSKEVPTEVISKLASLKDEKITGELEQLRKKLENKDLAKEDRDKVAVRIDELERIEFVFLNRGYKDRESFVMPLPGCPNCRNGSRSRTGH